MPFTLGFRRPIEAALLVLGTLVVVGIAARPAFFLWGIGGISLPRADCMRYHHHIYTLYLMALVVRVHAVRLLPGARPPLRSRRRAHRAAVGRAPPPAAAHHHLPDVGRLQALRCEWRSVWCSPIAWLRYGNRAIALGVPHALIDFLRSPLGGHRMAKGAISTESASPSPLAPRTRRLAGWAGIVFHVLIDFTTDVTSSAAVDSILYLFATYETPI